MTESAGNSSEESNSLYLRFEGGLADNGALLLDDYAASLEGWRDLFQLLGELYFHSFPELRKIRGSQLVRLEVIAERRGSYETWLIFVLGAAAGGIIGNRADALVMWSFRSLLQWYRTAISSYVQAKNESSDITAIAEALRQMTEQQGIPLVYEETSDDSEPLLPSPTTDEMAADEAEVTTEPIDRAEALAERLDQSLKHATQPLEHSCERLHLVTSDRTSVLAFGAAERAVIAAPLTLPPPKRDWRSVRVRFERINRKTGRALFYFESEDPRVHGARFSRIVDPAVRKPHNVYTRAFDEDELLDVWIRQSHPEKGRLNFQWEITARDPNQGTLFALPPPD